MLENRRAVEMDLPLKKEGLNVITAASGPIAGNLVLDFTREKCLISICAVAGRSLDNPFIKNVPGWELKAPFDKGLASTCRWISKQYQKCKVGQRVGIG